MEEGEVGRGEGRGGMEEGEVRGGEGRGNGNECWERGAGVGMGLLWGGGHAAWVLHNHTPHTLQVRDSHIWSH